ncbi:hypothetical protein FRC12_019305 [Ceratobasidium sp. 428]|nr:hypothetical protein FRC12_019305 [Ceratobasidium sp. 428]
MLKYGTHYKHQKDEQELRWRLEYRARTAEAQLLTQKRSRTPSEQGDVGMRDGFVPDDAEALQSTDFLPSRVATPEVAQPPPETPRWGSLSPIPKIPSRSSTPPPPTNSRSPSPLEIDYDSDESESDYTLPEHVFDDPPNLRLTYLNAICDHVVRKMTVRNAETSLRNTLNTLRLTPNALPPHITPLTTLKSICKHLRINASSLMRTVPVCSKCYKRYTFDDVSNLEIPTTCTRERPSCKGAFAKLEVTDGREKRVPTKVLIYSKVPASLRFMFLRPSFVNGLLDGAKARKLPRPENTLYDPSNGTAWNLARIGLRRIFRQDGSVSDEVITPGRDFLVSSLGYGIFAVLNIDWFSLTKKTKLRCDILGYFEPPRADTLSDPECHPGVHDLWPTRT